MRGEASTIRPAVPPPPTAKKRSSLPPLLHGRVHADFRNEQAYFTTVLEQIVSLYKIEPQSPVVANLRESLRGFPRDHSQPHTFEVAW